MAGGAARYVEADADSAVDLAAAEVPREEAAVHSAAVEVVAAVEAAVASAEAAAVEVVTEDGAVSAVAVDTKPDKKKKIPLPPSPFLSTYIFQLSPPPTTLDVFSLSSLRGCE